ncbi:DUF2563 family protein [Streptomyces sp. VRA16 Mangrove soil]|uniref:DUF2563 family protein n=1 Tax=Streptomyces sp. VRA16 Mangrove soil TaxID=2817434 RepID=UPI001A9E84BD|nr:DUF2563 family protein [Streptomyces sp. VRA16 Mangrove soil]MBO1334131.1 DUF2563 family protein [Streptomyces sp. VRA16 Mangrove soil]
MIPDSGGGGAAAVQALRVESETLSAFKRRVDGLLKDLESSQAAPKTIANGTMPTGRLGSFDEADALHSAYTQVHSQLENLSKMLALQIESLVVTVDAAKTGYHNLDHEVAARLRRIRSEANALTQPAAGKPAGDKPATGKDEPAPKPTDGEAGGL